MTRTCLKESCWIKSAIEQNLVFYSKDKILSDIICPEMTVIKVGQLWFPFEGIKFTFFYIKFLKYKKIEFYNV